MINRTYVGNKIGRNKKMVCTKNNIIILLLYLISIAITFSGCLGQSEPESAVVDSVKFLDNGEYEKLVNLYVNPNTLQQYTSQEKEKSIKGLRTLLGNNGENIQIQDFKITKKEKINDERYILTTYVKYKYTVMGETETKEENEILTIVKVNEEWKIADKLPAPGFDYILGIIGLIGSVYIIRRSKKLEK